MKILKGDLITLAENGEFDVIIHGCNCFCNMGAGIAKQIKSQYPWVYTADKLTERGDKNKLGTISTSCVEHERGRFVIVNGYTQYDWRAVKPYDKSIGTINADYLAIGSVFREVKKMYTGKRIAYPLIGAGLARGDWTIISKIIDCELEGEDHTLVKYYK